MLEVIEYDLFISYSTQDRSIAEYLVDRIEKRGATCFIAPRNIKVGKEYASEIICGIDSSRAVLLLFSSSSDGSAYVLREINSAVSRNKTIIPLRIENFLPSSAMEFYLGPTHWLDAFPEVLDTHLDQIFAIVMGLRSYAAPVKSMSVKVEGPVVMDVQEAIHNVGFSYKQITMRAIELDFLIISKERKPEQEKLNKTYEEWKGITDYSDAGGVLIEQDKMIGYCDFYPMDQNNYSRLMRGETLVQLDMIELYALGGCFCGYVAMMAVDPTLVSQERFLLLFDWLVSRVCRWKAKGIIFDRIGVEAYSPLLERFLQRFGFVKVGVNSDDGSLYETETRALFANTLFCRRYADKKDELADYFVS